MIQLWWVDHDLNNAIEPQEISTLTSASAYRTHKYQSSISELHKVDLMGLASNGTSLPVPWISETYGIMPPIRPSFLDSAPTWVLLVGAFFGLQILAVVLNVLRQLVSPTHASFLRVPPAGRQKS
jgi:hypothetical protein